MLAIARPKKKYAHSITLLWKVCDIDEYYTLPCLICTQAHKLFIIYKVYSLPIIKRNIMAM